MVANEIQPSAQQVPGLNQSRGLVRNIYKAKLGEVLEPQKAGDSYVVAIVTEINDEGTKPVAKARPLIEPLLRNKKIAEKIIQKIGNITTLEAAAAALGGKPIEQADSLRMIGAQSNAAMRVAGITSEPKIIGAAFNPSNKGKVVPQAIQGTSAVYVVRVNDVTATSVANANVADLRKAKYQQAKQQAGSPIQALRQTATIKDRRVNFF
jgi:peptidyl-prolyl cis-trans isomerase D